MRKSGCLRLVLTLLMLSQLAGAYALTPGGHAASAQAATTHCASHTGHSGKDTGPTAPGSCCEQPAGCHCPQAPALQGLEVVLPDGYADVAAPFPLRSPPPQLLTGEPFRPPI